MSLRSLECLLACVAVSAAWIGCNVDDEPTEDIGTKAQSLSGEQLFETATFDGNGRSCATCHVEENSFTMSPELAQELFAEDPDHPLFRPTDSDDGVGDSYTRLLRDASIRVEIPLPPTVRLHDDPSATVAVLNRAIPTIENVALEPVLMADGREPNLGVQAAGAVNAHFEPGVQPTAQQISKIVHYETKQFTSNDLKEVVEGGPDPGIPQGVTESEIRGQVFFEPNGRCGNCHGGPALNTTTDQHPFLPPGLRFEFIFAGYPEFLGGAPPHNRDVNPIQTWDFQCPEGGSFSCDVAPEVFGFVVEDGWVSIPTPDPGRGLVTGHPDDCFAFKITTLRNIDGTAPYFHDNSALTLEEVVSHYDLMFATFEGVGLTAQEQADIVAYMKLL